MYEHMTEGELVFQDARVFLQKLSSRCQSSANTNDVIGWRWLKGESELADNILF